jgi:hypothetical protein
MKYLKNIFESTIPNTIIDIDYIEDCFVELKDAGILKFKFNYHRNNSDFCSIRIKTNEINNEKILLDDIYKATEKKLEIIDEINYSLEKVKIKYEYMQYRISATNYTSKYILLELALDTSEHVIKFPSQWTNI